MIKKIIIILFAALINLMPIINVEAANTNANLIKINKIQKNNTIGSSELSITNNRKKQNNKKLVDKKIAYKNDKAKMHKYKRNRIYIFCASMIILVVGFSIFLKTQSHLNNKLLSKYFKIK